MDSDVIFVRHSNHSMAPTVRTERKIFSNNVEQHITYCQIFILPLIVIALLGNSAIIFTNLRRFILTKMNDSDIIETQLAMCDIFRAIFFCLVYLRNQWKESDLSSCIVIRKFPLILFSICNRLTLVLTPYVTVSYVIHFLELKVEFGNIILSCSSYGLGILRFLRKLNYLNFLSMK